MKKSIKFLFCLSTILSLFSCANNTHVHSYNEPTWKWDGYTSAKATFVCSSCQKETILVDDNIISYAQPKKSCFVDGVYNYIASVNLEGKIYTSKKTLVDPCDNKHGLLECVPYDDEFHQYRCVNCKEIVGNKAAHHYGEYEEKKAPTYTEEGIKERECSDCGHIQVTKIPKLKMSYSEVKAEFEKIKDVKSNNMYADSYFIDALEKYSYADLDNFTKEQKDDINACKNDVETKYANWKQYFGLVFEAENMGYSNTIMTTSIDYKSDKGKVTEIKSTLTTKEDWTYSVQMPEDVDDYSYISFSIYQDQPMDMLVMNTNWNQSIDIVKNKYYEGTPVHLSNVHTTNEWVTFMISTENWEKMSEVFICLYLTYDLDYGIRTTGKPAYLTNIYGIKDKYFEGQVKEVEDKITNLPSSSSLTAFDGSKIKDARNSYDFLPDSLKSQVKNYNNLVSIEEAYNSKWGVSFQMTTGLQNYVDFGGTFETKEVLSDVNYGDYYHYKINDASYALSFELADKVTTGFKSITFAVKSSEYMKFSLTTNYWWTDGYDFSTNSMYTGDALSQCNFYLSANTWTLLTIPVSNFNQINMVQLISGELNSSFDLSITSFYGVK